MRWQWIAAGKHPAAKDYFTIGNENAFSEAFSRWIEQGYHILPPDLKKPNRMGSWRFWAKTPNNEILILGLIKDSCDSIGRPYPLLIIGTGKPAGWEKHWDLIPALCEGIWMQVEYISARNYPDTKKLRDELANLTIPKWEWDSVASKDEIFGKFDNLIISKYEKHVNTYLQENEILIKLEQEMEDSMSSLVSLCHAILKNKIKSPPNAVFMGGVPGQSFFAAYGRALGPKDFVKLWSADQTTN